MEEWRINGYALEFDELTHTYLVDGVIVPSVTQLLKRRFGGKYDGIPAETMKRASERGTRVHKTIEMYCKEGEEDGSEELRNYKFLEKHYNFNAIKNEVPIILFHEDVPVCAGRLDLVLNFENWQAVADIKTTSTLDKDYLTYQLNIYRLALMQNEDINITKLYGLHIRENKRKLVEIPVNERMAWELIEEYESEELKK